MTTLQSIGEQELALVRKALDNPNPNSIDWKIQQSILEDALYKIFLVRTSLSSLNDWSDEEWKRVFGERAFEFAIVVQALVIEREALKDLPVPLGSATALREILKAHRRVRRFVPS